VVTGDDVHRVLAAAWCADCITAAADRAPAASGADAEQLDHGQAPDGYGDQVEAELEAAAAAAECERCAPAWVAAVLGHVGACAPAAGTPAWCAAHERPLPRAGRCPAVADALDLAEVAVRADRDQERTVKRPAAG
jgi:hypothetical protein